MFTVDLAVCSQVTWQLPFSISKYKVLHLGSQNPETAYTILGQDNTVDLAVVTEEKVLGIKFDLKLNFSKHIPYQKYDPKVSKG